MLLTSTWAIAEPVQVREGERVPFDGTLMTNEDAANLIVQLESCQQESELRLEEAAEVCEAEKTALEEQGLIKLDFAARECTAKLDYCETKVDLFSTQLHKEVKPNPFKDPGFAFVMGMITTGAIVGLSAVALHELQEAAQ